jgi:hypothetical protein
VSKSEQRAAVGRGRLVTERRGPSRATFPQDGPSSNSAPGWGRLSPSLGVKRGLLGFHLLYQLCEPINRKLIANRSGYALVVLDLAVEFDTFVTHFPLRICAQLAVNIGSCL